MSLKLVDRDYVPDGNGGVASGRGGEELLDEAEAGQNAAAKALILEYGREL